MSSQGSAYCRAGGCKYSNMPQNTSVTIVWRIPSFTCGTPSQRTSSQTRSQAETRRQETHRPHAQGWRSATESPWTLWHIGGSQQGHPRHTSASTEGGRGWPETRSTRHHSDETKVVTPRLGYQHTSRIVMVKKLCENLDGRKYRIGMCVRSSKTRFISVSFCGCIKMVGKEAECGSHVEEIEEKMWTQTNPHHFLTMKTWDVLSVNANQVKQLLHSKRRCLNHVFLLEQQKNYLDGNNLTHKK